MLGHVVYNTSLRRSNREQAQEQGNMDKDESSRGRSDRRYKELNLPSSSFLARSLDKDVLAKNTHKNRKRRTVSTGNLSLREDGDEDLNDDLDHNTDLPTLVAIDFSELTFLLEGTES